MGNEEMVGQRNQKGRIYPFPFSIFHVPIAFLRISMMTGSVAQDPDVLVQKIANLQSKGDDNYSEGLFPTQRTHRYFPYTVEDDTIFPTAVTVYTLQQVREALSERSRQIIDEVARRPSPIIRSISIIRGIRCTTSGKTFLKNASSPTASCCAGSGISISPKTSTRRPTST